MVALWHWSDCALLAWVYASIDRNLDDVCKKRNRQRNYSKKIFDDRLNPIDVRVGNNRSFVLQLEPLVVVPFVAICTILFVEFSRIFERMRKLRSFLKIIPDKVLFFALNLWIPWLKWYTIKFNVPAGIFEFCPLGRWLILRISC